MKGLLFLFCFLTGCSEHTITKVVTDTGPLVPNIVVSPESIDYGHLIAGLESLGDLVTIVNAGEGLLEITDIGIYGQSNFTFDRPVSYKLENSEKVEFNVYYEPETFEEKSAYLYIISNDPDESVIEIPIHGFGDAPVIDVNPLEVDRGIVYLGCEDITTVEINNLGNIDLIIGDLDFWISPPNDFSLIPPALPLTIPPNSVEIIEVPYVPEDLIPDIAMVDISSNDPVSPIITVNLAAESDYSEFITDSFEQASTRRVDILFVIDNSGSMNVFQTHLANNINAFMSAFALLNADYQIAVITTDNYNFQGQIVTNSSTDPVGELSAQVQTGTNGSGFERGVYMSYEALQAGRDAGPGSAFLREDSSLVIVYVSDERAGYSYNWMNYASYIETLKVDKNQIIAHSVVGDHPSGCSYNNGSYTRNVMSGIGYHDIVNHFGGSNYSICALDWGQQLQSMAFNSVPVLSYLLSSDGVIENTIEVKIEGQTTTAWWYNAENNEVNFNSADAPEDGEMIEITYASFDCQDEEIEE